MRKIAFGYSDRCNIRCGHCVAAGDASSKSSKMDLGKALDIIREMAVSGVRGISFTAGEPLLYFDDLLQLIGLCRDYKIYTRVVTNSFWADSRENARYYAELLGKNGLCQMRLSCSRWHQQHVPLDNVANAAYACINSGIDYFVSFVTDFSEDDDGHEAYLRRNGLKFFPEPMIYSGRASSFGRKRLMTDYQDNRCSMNPYLAPDLSMYGCCDAGSHFDTTNFFYLGSLKNSSVEQLYGKSETSPLYNCIRSMGITTIASFAGMKAREIVSYRKCDLCKMLFDSPEMLTKLEEAAAGELQRWCR